MQKKANIVVLSGICDMQSGYAIGAMLSGDILFGKTLFFWLYVTYQLFHKVRKIKAFAEHILKRMESKTEGLVSDDYHLMERWMDRFINIFSF